MTITRYGVGAYGMIEGLRGSYVNVLELIDTIDDVLDDDELVTTKLQSLRDFLCPPDSDEDKQ